MFSQLLFNMVWVSTWFIHFVDSNNNWYISRFSMVNGFNSLRHYTIIGSYYKNCDICRFSTTKTHSRKRFMTWSIKECNFIVVITNLVCTDMLSDTTCFACCYISLTNYVQQGCFTMVNVTHDSNNWRTRFQCFWCIFNFNNICWIFFRFYFCYSYTKFFSYDCSCININLLVNASHNT